MVGLRCSAHGSLVRDLALGRLDDASASGAEHALATCPTCRQWWETTLEGDAVTQVEAAVASALASFETPRSARRWAVALVAAAAALLVGLGVASLGRRAPAPVSARGVERAPAASGTGTLVAVLNFESGVVDAQGQAYVAPRTAPAPHVATRVAPARPKHPAPSEGPLNAVSMETGDLSGWSSHS